VKEGAEGAEVDVDDAVGLGQQACGFGRSLGTQEHGDGQQEHNPGHNQQRSTRASMHTLRSERPVRINPNIAGTDCRQPQSGSSALASESLLQIGVQVDVAAGDIQRFGPVREALFLDDNLVATWRECDGR
jgi:hypothetical protein